MLIVQGVALAMAMWTMDAPAASSSKDERVAAAYQNFEKQRHVEAALEFEGLWRDYKEPRFLFNAAIARYTTRHYAHAVAYLTEYLALAEVKGADRDEAKAQLVVAQREVAPLAVRVEGATAEPRVTARFVSTLSSDLRPELPVTLRGSDAAREGTIQLDPGTWIVRAEAAGSEPAEVEVKVANGASNQVSLALTQVPQGTGPGGQPGPGPARTFDGRKMGLGAVGVGAGLTVVGVVVTAVGQAQKFGPALKAEAASCAGWDALVECSSDLRGGATLRSAGAGVLGAGLGVVGSGAIWFVRSPKQRQLAWIVEMGVGGAALIGGIVGTAVGAGRFNAVNATAPATWEELQGGVKGPAAVFTASSAIAGFGLGLAAGAGLGFGLSKARTTKYASTLRLAGAPGRGAFGLSLSGQF